MDIRLISSLTAEDEDRLAPYYWRRQAPCSTGSASLTPSASKPQREGSWNTRALVFPMSRRG